MMLTDDEKLAAMRAMPKLLAKWSLTQVQCAEILGISHEFWDRIFTEDNITADEISDNQSNCMSALLGVHKNLTTAFGYYNREWFKKHNFDLDGKRPVDIMIEDGFEGIQRIRRYLDRDQT